MHPKNVFVVVSRHQEDTSWTQRLSAQGYHVAVYEHTPHTHGAYAVPVNRGREASAYFKYIIDHYDSLNLYTAFVHGAERSWHHSGSLVDLITRAHVSAGYKSLNNRCMSNILQNDKLPHVAKFFKRFLEPYIGPMSQYNNWTEGEECCAQFIVHRNRITRYPKRFYQDIYNKFLLSANTATLDDKLIGNVLEWTFNLLFNNPYRDGKLTRKQHAQRQQARAHTDNPSCRRI